MRTLRIQTEKRKHLFKMEIQNVFISMKFNSNFNWFYSLTSF